MTAATDTTPHVLNRALPGWAVDAIHDGVQTTDARRVYAKLVSIAMSAHRRGWTEQQYVGEIANVHSRLWAQLMTRRDGRTSSMPAAYKQLRKAWEYGVANANNVGMRTRDEIRDDAIELAYWWADRMDARSDGLSATETAVMTYIVAETQRRGMLRVTAPGREVAERAGIPHRTATRVLATLVDRGLLVKHSAGSRGEPGRGRAAIFALPVPEELAHRNGEVPLCANGQQRTETHEESRPTAAPTPGGGAPRRDATASTAPLGVAGLAHRDTTGEDSVSIPA